MDVCLVLGPRRDQSPRPVQETDTAPVFSTTKARREKRLSRLNSKAFILTVYASPRRSPGRHARLVSGCGPRSAGWDWLPTGFLRKVSELLLTSRPPFPGFAWRNEKAIRCHNIEASPLCTRASLRRERPAKADPDAMTRWGREFPATEKGGRHPAAWAVSGPGRSWACTGCSSTEPSPAERRGSVANATAPVYGAGGRRLAP